MLDCETLQHEDTLPLEGRSLGTKIPCGYRLVCVLQKTAVHLETAGTATVQWSVQMTCNHDHAMRFNIGEETE
jgi:hypothetical protein